MPPPHQSHQRTSVPYFVFETLLTKNTILANVENIYAIRVVFTLHMLPFWPFHSSVDMFSPLKANCPNHKSLLGQKDHVRCYCITARLLAGRTEAKWTCVERLGKYWKCICSEWQLLSAYFSSNRCLIFGLRLVTSMFIRLNLS